MISHLLFQPGLHKMVKLAKSVDDEVCEASFYHTGYSTDIWIYRARASTQLGGVSSDPLAGLFT